jgi:2-keto-3-deoxy-L-rhamnonate aldolase RhmA
MLLRCSAVFAIVAGEQQRGVASALAYPPLGERGREYFVRASARLMDDLKLTREQVEASLRAEVEALQQGIGEAAEPAGYIDSVMQPCLSALEASAL